MSEELNIPSLSDEEIVAMVKTKKRTIFDFKLQRTTTGIEKRHEYKNAKKDVARLLTELNKRKNNG